MDSSDEGKLFVGGVAWDTTEDTLRDYFSHYGEVVDLVIMRDKITGRPRGFGFVVFSDPSVLDRVLQDKHTIDGRTVEAKRALSREDQTSSKSGNFNGGRNSGGGENFKTKKIFVGGLPATLTEDGFREYFENYGHVTDVVIMFDQHTQKPRGFGFITFDTEDAVDRVLQKTFHDLNSKLVEVKRALPKDANPGGGGRGGGYHGYGANTSAVDGRMDGNRYMQPQSSAGGYPPYSGYGPPSYSYGGYGSYGVGNYGGPTGAYGVPGALRNTWSSQAPVGYGTNAGYGAPWNAINNSSSIPVSQSPGAAYGNQGYGYGNYGASSSPYSAGYGAAGGRTGNGPSGGDQQESGSGYSGGGYGESNMHPGYGNEAWSSGPSQVSGSYGGGYGGAHARQAPQQ